MSGLWCDGVMPPFFDKQLTKKSVNDTQKIVTTAYISDTEGSMFLK